MIPKIREKQNIAFGLRCPPGIVDLKNEKIGLLPNGSSPDQYAELLYKEQTIAIVYFSDKLKF